MRKIITLLATVALVVLCGMTVFAGQAHWEVRGEEDNTTWFYEDANGDLVTEKFVKSGDNWYWLNEDGIMATSALVDYNDNQYYVDADGKMVQNAWVKLADDEGDEHWMYFQSTGKAYKSGWKKIADKEYHFTDSKMDTGFLNSTPEMIDKDEDEAWAEATYYCGGEDDGAKRVNEWLQVDDFNAENGKNWIYFGANGQKVKDQKKTINGTTFVFKENGAIYTSFVDATISSASVAIDSYIDEDGKMLKKGWVYTYLNEDADDKNWFYAKGNGDLVKNEVKSIDGKKFAFDADGRMLTGFVEVKDSKPVTGKAYCANPYFAESEDDVVTFGKATSDLGQSEFMYFTESATPSEQGAAVTGKTTIAVDEANLTINFTSRGIAKGTDGKFTVKSGYAYINSVLYKLAEADYKFTPIKADDNIVYVLTNSTGKVAKKGTFTDNDNGIRYKFFEDGLYKQNKDADGKWPKDTWTKVEDSEIWTESFVK